MAISDHIIDALSQALDLLTIISGWILLRLLVCIAIASDIIGSSLLTLAHFGKWLFAPPFLIALAIGMPIIGISLFIFNVLGDCWNYLWPEIPGTARLPDIPQAFWYSVEVCAESWRSCVARSFGEIEERGVDLEPLNTTTKSSSENPPLPKVMEITKSRAQKIRREGVHGGTFFSPGVDTEKREAMEYPGMEMRGGLSERPRALGLSRPSRLRE